jgi:hypothetical protein
MADIGKASLIMAAMDLAAITIENGLPEVGEIVKELHDEGKITNVEYQAWKRKLASVGTGVSGDVLAIHAKLTDRAKTLGIDLPPPSSGHEELIRRVNEMVMPLSGGR